MQPFDHQQQNRVAWNRLAKERNRFARPASDLDFNEPLKSVDGPGWLGCDIGGMRVLCLAAGGGKQGPLYAAAGADVTVVDISAEMLELDRIVSHQRGLNLRVVESSMEDLSMFSNEEFDIVIHPVSTCYVPEVKRVYDEVARVTRAEGLYISQHKQPTSLQSSIKPTTEGYVLQIPWQRAKPLPESSAANMVRESGTCEFLHSWQDLIGKMCTAGFVIENVLEPDHSDAAATPGTFGHRSRFIPPYIRIKARRRPISSPTPSLWSPDG